MSPPLPSSSLLLASSLGTAAASSPSATVSCACSAPSKKSTFSPILTCRTQPTTQEQDESDENLAHFPNGRPSRCRLDSQASPVTPLDAGLLEDAEIPDDFEQWQHERSSASSFSEDSSCCQYSASGRGRRRTFPAVYVSPSTITSPKRRLGPNPMKTKTQSNPSEITADASSPTEAFSPCCRNVSAPSSRFEVPSILLENHFDFGA